jgi:hypothetical protein
MPGARAIFSTTVDGDGTQRPAPDFSFQLATLGFQL